jgi:2-oxoglutarate dehydrogenase E2 component (dihydrolipoamide succinyltransferase)
VKFVLPPLGETVTEARISTWLAKPGDTVATGDALVEVETDKVETELPSPGDGTIAEILVPAGETVAIGTVLALFAGADEPAAGSTTRSAQHQVAGPAVRVAPVPATNAEPLPSGEPRSHAVHPNAVRSPLVRSLLRRHELDPAAISGTGLNGRITRDDVLRHLEQGSVAAAIATAVTPPMDAAIPAIERPAAPDQEPVLVPDGASWVPFSGIRRRTAERMLASHRNAPAVTTAVQVDFHQVHATREAHKAAFRQRHGVALTYLPFVAFAAVNALREFDRLNASVHDDGLVVHRRVNLGIAVDLDHSGLVVPVVHDAGDLRFHALAKAISANASKARSKALTAADLTGSTFTITNPGGYGTLVGTPILNPPEAGILCVEGISKQPAVVQLANGEDALAIRWTWYLSLTWDHRAVDGAYAAAFLARIRTELQTADWAAEL